MVFRSVLRLQGKVGRWVAVGLLVLLCAQSSVAMELIRTTTVTALIQPTIEVALWPDESVELKAESLEAVWKSSEQRFLVKANVPWGIVATTDSPNGRLREFDISGDVYPANGLMTVNPLQIQVSGTASSVYLSSVPSALATDEAPTGDQGKEVAFHYSFMPSYQDVPLPSDRTYRIEVQFTVGAGY